MCKIGSPLLSFLLCSLCTPLQATILSTLENYNQLSDAEKETVENYSILENAIDTISALKQAEIETALEEIETLIKQAEMEQAEASCLELLESGNLSAEQEQMANDYLNDIALMITSY